MDFERKLIIMVGLPGSGKDTYIKSAMANNDKPFDSAAIASRDALREMFFGMYAYVPRFEATVKSCEHHIVAQLIADQQCNIVINETNLTKDKRKYWIQIAKSRGLTPVIYFIDTPMQECMARRAKVNRNIPAEQWVGIIKDMRESMEVPAEDEGCKVYRIAGGEDEC